jgi:UDP:flavonoid glycosyltransferase YjiC (YdhE family)
MTTKPPSEEGQFVPETVIEQFILQQAQSAAAAQRPTRQEAPSEKIDLVNPDPAEDNIPPPAYGDIYGEIRNEENGLGTSARVTDDGRVNIRINQVNRRLSQIFTPALRQQVESVQDSRPPPSPYIPPSLGGEKGIPPPPALNIVIQVVGSRGDVQPFVALGKVLKDTYGHRVRLATHPNFKDFVQENGLEFFSIGGDPSRLMAFMAKNPSLMPGFRSLLSGDISQRRKDVAEYIQGCWRSCYKAGDGMSFHATDDDLSARPFVADCIIANPPSFAHIHCAEKLGIPLHIMFTMPYSPTQAFPHPLANIQSTNADPQLTNYISYVMIEVLQWQGLGDIINRFRAKCLGLDPVSLIWGPGMLHRLKVPHTYCWSPALIPKPKDWGPHVSVSGYYSLKLASNYTPASDLQEFLDAGPPPVYIGFGSIVLEDPDAMMELIFEAVRKTGQRALLSRGWGGLGADRVRISDGVFMLDSVPHDWLFEHVSCVVHHGGAGTTAAGIAAGRPTVVVPFFGDQPFWGAMVARAGAGPDSIPHKQLTADKLADAINFCLKPESLERAKELASKIASEQGSDMGAQSFHQYLEGDRLRCMLAPSRPATWRIKRTQVRLSAFAACALANAKLLDFHNLKLFRSQEYETDEGPWDPISGGAAACFRAFSGMAMGVAEFPSETLKPLHIPIRSRQQSQKSVTAIAEQSQTSLNGPGSLARVGSLPSLSGLSSTSSNIGSSFMSDVLDGQLNPKQDDAGRRRVRSRNESGSGKDPDMLRQTGVHTSKGLGRIAKSAVKIPMEISVGLTKGFHNFPKLWGDDTVRPQEKVSDFKSGVMAVGKEFGYGWYDGVTGLVTQPWRGAQKEGPGGFLKGIGKGLGGFVTKPTAGFAGVLGHTMKGVHKEMQKLFGSNVQNYIVASRVAQGYEEWLQSSDTEKQDVIVRWKLIQKYLKERNSDETMLGVLKTQQKENKEDAEVRSVSVNAPTLDPETAKFAMGNSNPEDLHELAGVNETVQLPVQETSHRDAEEDTSTERVNQEDESQLQHQRQEAADDQAEQQNLLQAIAASESEAQRHASEALEFERQLNRAMAQSLREQRQRQSSSGSSVWQSDISLDEDDDEVELGSEETAEKVAESSSQQPPSYHPRHSQSEKVQPREKTAQERTEEEIVMEYVKKQSLLEAHHRNKGKSRAIAVEDEDDEDLQKTLKLSMQGHESDEIPRT